MPSIFVLGIPLGRKSNKIHRQTELYALTFFQAITNPHFAKRVQLRRRLLAE